MCRRAGPCWLETQERKVSLRIGAGRLIKWISLSGPAISVWNPRYDAKAVNLHICTNSYARIDPYRTPI